MHVHPAYRRRKKTVRTKLVILALSALSSALVVASENSDSCPIPKLEPGVPANVHLKHIDKNYCGIALIGGRYQKLSEITRRQEESRVTCDSESVCHKTIKYYLGDDDKTPYIIEFSGPRRLGAENRNDHA